MLRNLGITAIPLHGQMSQVPADVEISLFALSWIENICPLSTQLRVSCGFCSNSKNVADADPAVKKTVRQLLLV